MEADNTLTLGLGVRSDSVRRAEYGGTVPFFLRSWWLRDRVGFEDIEFGIGSTATHPLWSLHSDPICDAANIDTFGV
ncbi:MAG: hypothetical protein JST89_16900 [Cyanobacteria bacterium SZAS-4]|nr:hypothetical protein [Cyanobacteria bacterium SZAS-4]